VALRRDVGQDEKRDEKREEEREGEEEEGEEDEEEEQDEAITEYEKQHLKTIERNKAMLASLQLPDLASSLVQSSKASKAGSISKSKGGGPHRRSERLKSVSGKRR
jgi:TATA-binding protein-associated factor Taf7